MASALLKPSAYSAIATEIPKMIPMTPITIEISVSLSLISLDRPSLFSAASAACVPFGIGERLLWNFTHLPGVGREKRGKWWNQGAPTPHPNQTEAHAPPCDPCEYIQIIFASHIGDRCSAVRLPRTRAAEGVWAAVRLRRRQRSRGRRCDPGWSAGGLVSANAGHDEQPRRAGAAWHEELPTATPPA